MATNDPYGPLIQSAAQQAGVDPFVLRGLLQSESSLNPTAVSKDKNGNPVAYGIAQFTPQTAKAMGVSNPMDPAQAIPGAAKLLRQNLDQTGGNVPQAIATYKAGTDQSGWGPMTVTGTKNALQYADQARGAAATSSDPVLGFMNQQSAAKGGNAASAAPQSAASTDPTLAFMNGQPQPSGASPQPSQSPPQTAQPQSPKMAKATQIAGLDPISDAVDSAAVHGLSGMAGSVAGLGAGALKALTTGGDWAQANQAWNDTAGKVSGAIDSALSPNGNTAAARVGQAVADMPGRVIGAGIDAGSNVINTAAQSLGASPATAQKISDLTKFGANAGLTVMGGKAMLKDRAPVAADAASTMPETPVEPVAQVQEAGAQQGAPEVQAASAQAAPPGPAQQPQSAPMQSQAAGQMAPAPAVAPIPAADLPVPSGKASDLFPTPDKAPTVAGPVSASEQAQRLAVVQALGLDRVRDSVITGDAKQSGIEYQNAKVDSPIGNVTRDTIADEQNAIRGYAGQINDMTGRDPALDAEGSGQKILAPFQKMSDWFDDKAGQLYQSAREQAGNAPMKEAPALTGLLSDPDIADRMQASPDAQAAYGAVQRRASRFFGLEDATTPEVAADGSPAPARTVNNAENFRQWLNAVGKDNPRQQWFISRAKQALDEDVAASGGDGLFNEARGLWQQRQQMLADPGKLSKLLADPNGTGLNRSVAPERVGQTVVNMDGGNFRNVLDSLTKIQKMAPELAPDVEGALAEIRGQAARQLTDAGGKTEYWNANQFSKAAQVMAPKLKLLFNNNELGALRTLNEAGRIIRQPGAYPGAAAQHINMFHSGMATALPYAANAAGNFIAGPMGGILGQMAGGKLSSLAKKGGEAATAAKLAKQYAKNAQPQ
ncbi:transglycosylase SLT domain-containing protein [Paraburkholderia sediminicola]|uniref:transglycosylase SLT domain-containing protein n=1 Tax=Paraburkholderia sediminicola TaxID=458836 RepID=UPI0038BA2C91